MNKENRKSLNIQKKMKQQVKMSEEKNLYNSPNAYKVFTIVNISGIKLEFDIKLPYNFIVKNVDGFPTQDISMLCRCSDLLLITIGSDEINEELISVIKRFMPTSIIVYEKSNKNTAKKVSKSFGDIKICEKSMLNLLLKSLETQNTTICTTRPFMVAQNAEYSGEYLYVKGFMKQGLRSDKVIINGSVQGLIEEFEVEGNIMNGSELNEEENESLIKKEPDANENETNEESFELDEASVDDEYENFNEEEVLQYGLEQDQLHPDFDLIEKYKDFRGIRNLATCDFKDHDKPEHYKELCFYKDMNAVQKIIKKGKSKINPNSMVSLKIRVFESIASNYIVMFGLFPYENKKTIMNYEFKSSSPIGKNIIVDNGYMLFNTSSILTRNYANKVFKEDSETTNGIISFISPLLLFAPSAYVFDGEKITKISNGESYDRIFFECVELTGNPIKLFKRHCIIKDMFYNKEQVEYFSSLKLEAKNDNRGFIKKALGTKGLFKAFFTHKIKQNEIVKLSLYKRIFLE